MKKFIAGYGAIALTSAIAVNTALNGILSDEVDPVEVAFNTEMLLDDKLHSMTTKQIITPDEYEIAIEEHSISDTEKIHWCKKNQDCVSVAKVVIYEARGESLKGRYAVASVVLNRVNDDRWPNSIRGVVYQPKQFDGVWTIHRQKNVTKKDVDSAMVVGYDVLRGEVDPVVDATHFHTKDSKKPRWAYKFDQVATIGNHIFYQ